MTNAAEHTPPQTGPDVTVTFENKPKTIHRGSHPVSDLKSLFGVPPEYAVAQVIEGVITPLKDDARVTIKGGEVFFQGPRTGGSSHA